MKDYSIWLGHEYEARRLFALQHSAGLNVELFHKQSEDLPNPVTLDVVDNVGIISTSGSTYSTTDFFTRLFGIPTYEDIKETLGMAAEDDNIKVVVHRINSSGGNADGVSSLASFIRSYNNGVKPVVTFATKALSAGYWYGSAASKMIADEDSEVGSIGAIAIHTSYKDMYAKEGIEHTVFRSAPHKAPVTPVEKLSAIATKTIEDELKFHADRFANGIALNRGLTIEKVNKDISTGKVFHSEEALEKGLIDSVMSIEEIVGRLNSTFKKKEK